MSEEKESVARSHLPYRAEYCKTSRARCKKCNEPMLAGSLKLASSTKSRFHDGYDYHFHHLDCFFRIKRPASVAEIGHFETLKYDDQKMLEKAIETKGSSIMKKSPDEISSKSKAATAGKKKKRDEPAADLKNYEDFLVEYAKSSRSQCIKCEKKIEKDLVRIGKLDYNADTAFKGGPIPRWYHSECFAKCLEKLEFDGDISKINGFDELEKSDQKSLKRSIKPEPKKELADGDVKRPKKEDEDVDVEEEKALKKQSDRFFRLRECVATMKRKEMEVMLELMRQKHDFKHNTTGLVDAATDVLMFGPIDKCPECKQFGFMQLRAGRYICTYEKSEGSQCTYETIEPSRSKPFVPEEIMDSYDFFGSLRLKVRKRLFPKNLRKAVEEKEAEINATVMEDGPLEGLTLGVTSWQAINADKTKVQNKVTMLGGTLVTALDRSLFVILTSEEELSKETPKIEVAKALEVPFANEKFLFSLKTKADVVKELSKCLIGEWDGDLTERFEQMRSGHKSVSPVKAE